MILTQFSLSQIFSMCPRETLNSLQRICLDLQHVIAIVINTEKVKTVMEQVFLVESCPTLTACYCCCRLIMLAQDVKKSFDWLLSDVLIVVNLSVVFVYPDHDVGLGHVYSQHCHPGRRSLLGLSDRRCRGCCSESSSSTTFTSKTDVHTIRQWTS